MTQRPGQVALLVDHMHRCGDHPQIAAQPGQLTAARRAMGQALTGPAECRQQTALGQTLGIDDQVVGLAAYLADQGSEQGDPFNQRRRAQLPARQTMDASDDLRAIQQTGPAVLTQPMDPVTGGIQVGGQGQGVDDVAKGAQSDDQDAHPGCMVATQAIRPPSPHRGPG